MDCKTHGQPINHSQENEDNNRLEIERAIYNQYPDIIKIISVGNEAMVHWATSIMSNPR